MTVTVTKIYTDVQVDDEHTIIFPPTVQGSIRPGTLDHLSRVRYIRWGDNMLGEIEPGVIPKRCAALMLPAGYTHTMPEDFDRGKLLYIHHTQIATVTSSRLVSLWREASEPAPVIPAGYKINVDWYNSSNFKGNLVLDVEIVPIVVPEPVVVTQSEPVPKPFVFTLESFDALLAKSKIESESCETYANQMAITINDEINRAADEGRLHNQFFFEFKCMAPRDKTIEVLDGIFGLRLLIVKSPCVLNKVHVTLRRDYM